MANNTQHNFCIFYYIEAGCLGANGAQVVDGFCDFLEKKLNSTHAKLCYWSIQPLSDINLPHFKYVLEDKKLSLEQATRYLEKHQFTLKQFEDDIDDLVIDFIEEYLGR